MSISHIRIWLWYTYLQSPWEDVALKVTVSSVNNTNVTYKAQLIGRTIAMTSKVVIAGLRCGLLVQW